MRYLLPILFLACAPPREYRDGARLPPAAPRTTYAPAGTGLPEYWGRPERKPDVEPNPKPTRLLPPSMGPGIWAASDPERPVDWVDLLVLDIPFPMPVVDPGDASERVARMCEAGIGRTAANAPAMVAALMRLPPERRRCIVAQTYQTCVEAVRNRFMASADPPPTKEERYALDVAVGAARSGTIAACRFPLAPEEVALADQWADLPIPSPRMSH